MKFSPAHKIYRVVFFIGCWAKPRLLISNHLLGDPFYGTLNLLQGICYDNFTSPPKLHKCSIMKPKDGRVYYWLYFVQVMVTGGAATPQSLIPAVTL